MPELKLLHTNYVKLINVLKVQGESIYSHFVSAEIITLEAYNDCSEAHHSPTSKAKWIIDTISSHLEAGYCATFQKMLLILREHGDLVCKLLSNEIKKDLAASKTIAVLGTYKLYIK